MERPPMERALSTDVVMDVVLSHLRVEDLLSCRKVSKFWNKAASSVLRKRSTMIKSISKKKTLKELEECLKQSSDFPFAGLTFDQPARLQSAGAMRFFKNHGARFNCIYLSISSKTRLQDIAPFLHHLPHLSSLEVGWSNRLPPPAESSDSDAGREDDRILNLPSLRTFRISGSRLNEDVLRGVCTAASPSLRIECLWPTYGTLRALKSAGKLQAVAVLKVIQDPNNQEDQLRVDELLSTETPALTKLDFKAEGCISQQGLMTLLRSSQRTLKELDLVGICPADFLSECPVLPKLTTLSVYVEKYCEYFFRGSHGHKFPVLSELQLNTSPYYRISDGRFIVPSVTTIDLFRCVVEANLMKELAQAFPNVVAIGLEYDSYSEIQENAEPGESNFIYDIWSVREFKQLEKLRIRDFVATRPTKNYLSMDSFLTGIPLSIVQKLQKEKPELMLGLIKSPFGETFSNVIRENPSILQLKNLKELIIGVELESEEEELPEESPFMSMVSVWFALEIMPNLDAKFVYDVRKVNTAKDVEMLKAAFKHVQPYVKLEPFFY